MKNVKEYLEKAYAAAMYEELYETAGLIEVGIESLRNATEKGSRDCSCSTPDAEEEAQENVVVFPVEYSK